MEIHVFYSSYHLPLHTYGGETMEKKVDVYCNTKRFEGDDAVRTKLTLDFSACTDEDIMSMAVDSAVIKWQSAIRRKKDTAVPREATYIVPKPGTRAQTTMTQFEMLCGVFGKEKVLELVNKAGGDIDAVIEKFKALIEE
jgi:hypothetical protein